MGLYGREQETYIVAATNAKRMDQSRRSGEKYTQNRKWWEKTTRGNDFECSSLIGLTL